MHVACAFMVIAVAFLAGCDGGEGAGKSRDAVEEDRISSEDRPEQLDKSAYARYRLDAPLNYSVDMPVWTDAKYRFDVLTPLERKYLFVFTLADCNKNNELLEQDQNKIISVQRVLLADLAAEAGWVEMAWNCQTETLIRAAVVRGEIMDEDDLEKALSDLNKLLAARGQLIARELNDSGLESSYRRHKLLFDETANVVVALPKIAVWGGESP